MHDGDRYQFVGALLLFRAGKLFHALARHFTKLPLRLSARLRTFRLQSTVGAIRLQLARLHAIVQDRWNHVANDLIAQCRRLDRERDFDSSEEISRHPVRARKVNERISSGFEIVDAAVFEKAANNADDANVLTEIGNLRTQTTDAPHEQIDSHIGARSSIKSCDD